MKEGKEMQKLSIGKLNELKHLTKNELNLFLLLTTLQDEEGFIIRFTYKDAKKYLGFCIQSYYNAINKLIELGIIQINSCQNIFIPNNTKTDCKNGYLYLNKSFFHSSAFRSLRAKSQLLILQFYYHAGRTGCYIKRKKNFVNEWAEYLEASPRMVRQYMNDAKKSMDITIKNGCYYISPKSDFYRHKHIRNADDSFMNHNIEKILAQEGFDCDDKSAKDVTHLFHQYSKQNSKEKLAAAFCMTVKRVVHYAFSKVELRKLDRIKIRKKKKFSPSFFHKIFRETLIKNDNISIPGASILRCFLGGIYSPSIYIANVLKEMTI